MENKAINYPSSDIVFALAQSEYNYELSRIQKVDNKINFAFTLLIGIFMFIVGLLNFNDIFKLLQGNSSLLCATTLCVLLIFFYFTAFVILLFAIKSREYFHLDANKIIHTNMHMELESVTKMYAAVKFTSAININRAISNKRMVWFNVALLFIVIIIGLAVGLQCMKYNIFR